MTVTSGAARAFVLRHTDLRAVPGLEEIRLHLAAEVLPLWRAVQVETGDPDAALPYWAFAWAGGLAIGRYLRQHPEAVAGRRVFDLASGSGLCAIAAMGAGAASATAADIDAFAAAAIDRNARANGQRVSVVRRDVLDEEPPAVDIILAGDCWYEAGLAERVLSWLRRARERGVDVLVGDPGRHYLPTDALVELAAYEVRTTTELEDLARKEGRVYALRPVAGSAASR
jgi:predicted nicotinamide N-methyase